MDLRVNLKNFWLYLFQLSLSFFICLSHATAGTRPDGSSTTLNPFVLPTSASTSSSCAYFFSDTYASTISSNPPTTTTNLNTDVTSGYPYFGAPLPLSFNAIGNVLTPIINCDGYYLINFTLEIKNNLGMTCNWGLISGFVYVGTTDPKVADAFGCPVTYYNIASGNLPPPLVPGETFGFSGCPSASFSQYVQCTWTSSTATSIQPPVNYAARSGHYGPVFLYTPYFSYAYGNTTPYAQTPYVGMGWSNVTQSTTNPVNNLPGKLLPYNSTYCALKTIPFQTVVYLHANAQIMAPIIYPQAVATPYYCYGCTASGSAYTQFSQIQLCGYSIVGGHFTLTYLHA
jgi:hypothetical protein